MALPDLPIVYKTFAHHDCVHNQLVSFHNRVGGLVTRPQRSGLRRMRSVLDRISASFPQIIVWDLDRVVDHYKGPRRVLYSAAALEYRSSGLHEAHSKVKMFIKNEKIKFTTGKVNPDPRAIQHRDPVFAVVLAQYIKAIEEYYYKVKGTKQNRLPPDRIFGKGLNSRQRGELLHKKFLRFKRPVVLSIDITRLDRSADIETITMLHAHFLSMIKERQFAQMLSQTKKNKVRTSRGLRYVVEGNIMSGDVHTSLQGNAYMGSATVSNLEALDLDIYDILCDGDDCLVIVEQTDHARVSAALPGLYLEQGMEAKIEEGVTTMEQVEWCQSSPVLIGGSYRFVRNPGKVLSGALVGPRWLQMHSEAAKRALANTIGLGEAILHQGVPVLQEFALAIIRNASTNRQVKLSHNDSLSFKVRHEIGKSWLSKIPTLEAVPVEDDTRLSFALAFGITIDEQLAYEKYLRTWKFEFNSFHEQTEAVDVANWSWACSELERV